MPGLVVLELMKSLQCKRSFKMDPAASLKIRREEERVSPGGLTEGETSVYMLPPTG